MEIRKSTTVYTLLALGSCMGLIKSARFDRSFSMEKIYQEARKP
jgi:hypothetical protein